MSEKAVGMIEKENKIIFVVEKEATKAQIKKAIEELYGVKVEKVNTIRTIKGPKKALVKLSKESSALDLATKLKLM